MFEKLTGLPAHPLLVHLPVVLLPLVALGVVALAVRPAWRPRFAVVVLGLAVVGALGAVGAALTGDALAATVGTPATHRVLGIALAVTSVMFLLVVGPWLWRVRTATAAAGGKAMAAVAVVLSAAVVTLTVLTGHSGATAVWGGTVGSTAAPAPSGGSSDGYSLAEVADHNTAVSCWAAIEGNVYDLTDWIGQHPGGASRIEALCGTDATAAFTAQHGGQARPASQLAQFLLGPLAE
ncbi:MAG: cytochrome b5-like heme/steroid binding domain-containing protein [Arachnia sp.]